jgi:hypothetical protein
VLDQPFGCGKGASFGYFSLHKQRKVTRSAGAKAFAVEVVVAFDNKQKHRRAAEQAPFYESMPPARTSLDPRLRGDDGR